MSLETSVLVFGSFGIVFAQTVEVVDVVENKMVTLIAEAFDEDGNDLDFVWKQIDGEPVVLSSNTAKNPQFMAALYIIHQIEIVEERKINTKK